MTDWPEQVIQKIGLCICLYDLLWASEGLVRQGTGNANVNGTASFHERNGRNCRIRQLTPCH